MSSLSDAPWIKAFPADWLPAQLAFELLRDGLMAHLNGADPAPWFNPRMPATMGGAFGESPEEWRSSEKLAERLIRAFQSALICGTLRSALHRDGEMRDLPRKTFGAREVVRDALFFGYCELDPLWPDDWQPWSGADWGILRSDFEAWVNSGEAFALPKLDAKAEITGPDQVRFREPSEGAHVPLSEAVTWVAFGLALDGDRLARAVRWESLANGDLKAGQLQVKDAAHSLLTAGLDGRLTFYGRHVQSHGEKGQLTRRIERLGLIDYRAFIIGHDHLYYGDGPLLTYTATNASHLQVGHRHDLFENVTVDRAELLKCFPPDTENCGESGATTSTFKAARRKRPGPPPDPDWPGAIASVAQECISAGYKRPLKRGDKAAIQTMLLNYMSARNKNFSEDIARKHADSVIAALPDN